MTAEGREHSLERVAEDLAKDQNVARGPARRIPLLDAIEDVLPWLARATRALRSPEASTVKAAEWLLDNAYLVPRAVRQVRRDLPRAFYARLAVLTTTPAAGRTRIEAIARRLLEASEVQVTTAATVEFLRAYQKRAHLTIAELWALPTMLRLGCLDVMISAVHRLVPSLPAHVGSEPCGCSPALDDTECVARALRSLRSLSSIQWREVFQATSVVEGVLREDPDGAYPGMEFETCDAYRRVVERIAWGTGLDEPFVARRAVDASREARSEDPARHVGHWLVGTGRAAFERLVGYEPTGAERGRRLLARHATPIYLSAIALATALFLAPVALLLSTAGAGVGMTLLGLAAALLPASTLGVSATNFLVTMLVHPRALPKMDYSAGIPASARTAVVMPALLGSPAEVDRLLEQIERHHLGNPSPAFAFALLTDFVDAPAASMPEDDALVERAVEGIRRLNRRHGRGGPGPFHLLHRSRRWNPAEGCWMGWERKRGKLEALNRLLLGEDAAAFEVREGDAAGLTAVRFVLTLDADTSLPRQAASRLVGIAAHPLNRPRIDEATRRVTSGYGVVQPRVQTRPEAAHRTPFARLLAGDSAIDIYSHAVSDVYQDLFGVGSYVGKGLYDLAAFRRSLAGRVPADSILSHDLFEGLYARVALATDVVLYEDTPDHYVTFAERMHRWIRGDWQLVPWLARRVRAEDGTRALNVLGAVDRWKILDNLRRSLFAPSLLVFLALGWLVLPGSPALWTLLALLVPASPAVAGFLGAASRALRRRPVARAGQNAVEAAGRWFLQVALLPHEAVVAADAALRTLWRVYVTRRRLLQWTSSEHVRRSVKRLRSGVAVWLRLSGAPITAVALATAVALVRPAALPWAAPLFLAWLAAPAIAAAVSRPRRRRREPLGAEDVTFLRGVARRTWLFFETFAGPEDQWLPPDNYQEDRRGDVAHRTSPTNIGMYLLSSVAAWDLGYLGTRALRARLQATMDTLRRMQRHRGHLLNWYETRTLQPLSPTYVSTADSGNLAAALLTVARGCQEIADAPIFSPHTWDGLADGLGLLAQAVASATVAPGGADAESLPARVERLRQDALRVREHPHEWWRTAHRMADEDLPAVEHAVLSAVGHMGGDLGLHVLREVRVWLDRSRRRAEEIRDGMRTLLPWLAWTSTGPAGTPAAGAPGAPTPPPEVVERLRDPSVTLSQVPERVNLARSYLADGPARAAAEEALRNAEQEALALSEGLRSLARQAREDALGMDFGFLYDPTCHLFHIGYLPESGRLDTHHYDLLASESCIASFVAIAKGDVPVRHWFFLGRPLRRVRRRPVLLSWGGTMFEYLMPPLLIRSLDDTLLARSQAVAVEQQARTGASLGIPWGMSESGYAGVDAHGSFQYRAFGDPVLGIKRGLEEDTVVAPYASALALAVRPAFATQNLRALADLGLLQTFGFHEAVDFTRGRAPAGQRFATVASYMAHHQGMILVSVDNVLNGDPMPRRLLADPHVRTVSVLLNERVPPLPDLEPAPIATSGPAQPPRTVAPLIPPWSPAQSTRFPEVHLLGNGRLASLVTDGGGGGLTWQGLAVSRWVPDACLDDRGSWIYVRDDDDGALWSAGRMPIPSAGAEVNVTFTAESVEFHRRERGISTRLDIAVAASDDVEVRLLTLSNETDRPRRLTVASCFEVVLAAPAEDARHPAFGKLFVEGRWIEESQALVFTRRPREPAEPRPVLLHRCVTGGEGVRVVRAETDRQRFLGRHGTWRAPLGLTTAPGPSTVQGPDPVASLEVRVVLPPRTVRRVAFVTVLGGSTNGVVETAERYGNLEAIDWLLADASAGARRLAQTLGLLPRHVVRSQELLSIALYRSPPTARALEARERCVHGQHRLWGLGLSGDLPILVLRLPEGKDLSLLDDLLAVQAWWRARRWGADLVVVRAGGGYDDAGVDPIRRLLRERGAEEQVGRRGGVHVLRSDHLRPEEQDLLDVTAALVLEETRGTLEAQIAGRQAVAAPIPAFGPTRSPEGRDVDPPLPRPEGLLFDNGLGGFSDGGREYVLHLPPGASTPAPWSNVLANESFGSLVTEAGLGCTWAMNSAENRLTPWSNDMVVDPPGEVLYLRDEETGEVWTPTPEPAGRRFPTEVRHGAGTTAWRQSAFGFEQQVLTSVAPDDPVKIVRLRVRNALARPRRITVTYYAEWVLGTTRAAHAMHARTTYDVDSAALLAWSTWNPDFAGRVAFLASDRPTHGFTTDRTEFFGREGSRSRPAGLVRWGLSGATPPGADPCAALQVYVGLPPGGEEEVVFLLGQGRDREEARALVARWRDKSVREAGGRETEARWESRLGAIRVRTPDPALDVMLNRWLLYQTVAGRLDGRTGFQQPSGAYGFRDQLQDVMALLHVEPERVRRHLLECARRQFEEGDVLHWWHPPSGRGVRTRCSDDLLWLPYVTARYVEATGDATVLDERVPFLAGPALTEDERQRLDVFRESAEHGTLFEHCRRAVERGLTAGSHGLPLMLDGDWNDGMNRIGWRGVGESVWLAWFSIAVLDAFAGLCERRGEAEVASRWRRVRENLAVAVEQHAWDGEWYLRAFDDEGHRIGSVSSDECRIDSVAQSWSVLSGAGAPERARRALAAARRELFVEDEGLIRLFWPPFDRSPRDPGYVKGYPPGRRENGGHYSHGAAWLGWALAAVGDGDAAVRVLRAMLPLSHAATPDDVASYGGEPYAIAGDVATAAPYRGRSGWTWYTGSAAWTWRLGIEAILGLTLVEGRLRIDPSIPADWPGYEAEVRRGGGVLLVKVENPDGVGRGVLSVFVDGAEIEGNLVDAPPSGTQRTVRVLLGTRATANRRP